MLILFLPGLLIGLYGSWHKGVLKTLVAHPSVFLLPVFSFFTFASNSKVCCCRGERQTGETGKEKTFITFSPKYTAINAGVCAAECLVGLVFALVMRWDAMGSVILIGTLFFLAIPLTLAATFSNQCTCCRSCCCSCCTEPFEIGALLPDSPRTPYILGSDGQLRKQEQEQEEKQEEEQEEEEISMEEGSDIRV